MIRPLIDSGKFKDPCSEPEEVADAIVDQIYSGYGAQIFVPRKMKYKPLVRGLPTWFQENARDSVTQVLLLAMGRL